MAEGNFPGAAKAAEDRIARGFQAPPADIDDIPATPSWLGIAPPTAERLAGGEKPDRRSENVAALVPVIGSSAEANAAAVADAEYQDQDREEVAQIESEGD